MAIEIVIEGGGWPRSGRALSELWGFRWTILAFAERDIRVKYKQAFLGVAWAVIQPVAFMGIFAVAFGRMGRITGDGVAYPAFALAVLVPWMFLQTAVMFGSNALLADSSIIRKVYLPREVPVLGAVGAALVDLGIGLALFGIVGPFLGARPSFAWLLAPLLVVPIALLAAAVALLLAGLNVYYRDFRYALPFALQLWLFASPVAYPLTVVPERIRWAYVMLNPAAGSLDAFRRVLALGSVPDASMLGVSLLATSLLLMIGYRVFKSLEPSFADVV